MPPRRVAIGPQSGGDPTEVHRQDRIKGPTVYAATKFAQVGLAGGLDRELHGAGIRVSVIAQGGVATEFAMGTGRTPDMPGLEMIRPEDVAEAVVAVLKQPSSMRTLVGSMRSIHEDD